MPKVRTPLVAENGYDVAEPCRVALTGVGGRAFSLCAC